MIRGYARVSTAEQNLSMQLDALINYGCDVENIYTDKMSGSIDERPGLERLEKDLKEGDTLVVWSFNRLGRSVQHLSQYIAKLCTQKINFVSLREAIDLSTPSGKFQAHIFACMAEYQREMILEAARSGIESAKQRNVRFGAPKATNEDQDVIMSKMHSNGMSLQEIAAAMNVSKRTVMRRLASKVH